MHTPLLEIDLAKIKYNAQRIKDFCEKSDIDICIVTKGFCAELPIVEALIEDGHNFFGDARIQNIAKIKREFPDVKYMMIRIPKISEAEEVIRYADISLQSQLEVIKAYSDKAKSMGKVHSIILMIDVGDLREGVMPENSGALVEDILAMNGVRLIGIGTNVGCYGGILPTVENAKILVNLRDSLEKAYGIELPIISGGSTCALKLLREGKLPKEINNLRIGEAVILGEDSTNGLFIENLHRDAFILKAEVVELRQKPSVPMGRSGYDAFGNQPVFLDKGIRKRAILAIGRQDVRIEALAPVSEGMEILGGSSDHLIVDVTDSKEKVEPGSLIAFRCAYSAVLSLTTSPYVEKVFMPLASGR
ncbi:alanine/ornithine racemase family PLP-dependent enzyme [Lutispora saccharofermentans]|uniref:Alanine/ornithine racemase family PLP-dependent enzyme n=1 Tax=Lutispora saccharofermentans TaxID=3024236 RepID=A0ABT1NGL3_9FIRM|nr:alanine/ornithine racemase family PLP-dependent enzyme [Lutispora saccharofermentans]MCQ1528991.1 alanine/ornithine racemase family PLP-dependent enzyme [Lutispora saccharofermentans]